VPDFYAKRAIGKQATCLGPLDKVLQPAYEALGICKSMYDYGYS